MGDDELDLDQELAALDLDTDFLASNDDFPCAEEATAEAAPVPTPTTSPTRNKTKPKSDLGPWADRPEIYSRHFKPNPAEREELEKIATLLGVKSGLPSNKGKNLVDNLLGGGSGDDADESDPHNPQSQWNRLVVGKATRQTQNLPISLLLRQGTVLYKDVDEDTGDKTTHHGCQLVLFTRGFLIAKPEIKNGFFGKKTETLQPLGSALWTNVCQIQTTVHQTILLTCGSSTNQVKFEVLPSKDIPIWTRALQTAATQAHTQFEATNDGHYERGWQYRLCQTPWFTEAVTGEWEDVGLELSTSDSAEQGLDQLDDYHRYAPLHYATRAGHLDVMRHLLQAGANPNVEDGEGKTPMYYAERDQLHHAIVALLTEFGGIHSQKAEEEMRGELFGKVADTERAREEKREADAAAKAAQEKAATAQSQMAQNLAAMHKRGEMIEELGDKASDLQDGAQDYADMAAQLKEKMKKKSVWGF